MAIIQSTSLKVKVNVKGVLCGIHVADRSTSTSTLQPLLINLLIAADYDEASH
jgi:hypothetical protein